MEYPAYYKNGNRCTVLLGDNKFVQVKTLNKVATLTAGENRYIVEDTLNYDKPTTEEEFATAITGFENSVDQLIQSA